MLDRKLIDHFSVTHRKQRKQTGGEGKLLAPSHMCPPARLLPRRIQKCSQTPPQCVFGCEHVQVQVLSEFRG